MDADPTPLLISNPPNPYSPSEIEWYDLPPPAELKIYEDTTKGIIARNDSPDISFQYSVNPYRGCFHACAYCYARPSHQYLGFGAGTDFERNIVVKLAAPKLLRDEFMKRSWNGEAITFSGNTDCYQPLEFTYGLTRGCLEVCKEFKNPVCIITKGSLIERDLELLRDLNEVTSVQVVMSIAFVDDEMSKAIEPGAPRPSRRFRTMKLLSDAGITVGLAAAPIIPGLNDSQIGELLNRAKECGATSAFMTLLRLPAEVKSVFAQRIEENFPTKSKKVFNQIKDVRGGKLNNSDFGSRMRGSGPRWDAIKWLFDSKVKALGLNRRMNTVEKVKTFCRPSHQMELFE